MVTRSKFLWPGSERRHCRRQGEHTRPGCIARRPRRAQPAVARAQMEGGVKGSYHYHRKEHGHQDTSLIPKAVRRGRRTITRGTRVLPESDLAASIGTAICNIQQICQKATGAETVFENRYN